MLGPEAFDVNQARAELRAALQSEQPVKCWVTGVIKGGLEVDYGGVRAFAPASHVDMKPTSDLSHLLGEPLEFVVTHYAKKGRDVVVSRKQMIEAEYKEKRAEQLEKLEIGAKVKATVRTVLQWGVFVSLPEFDDIEGVIHMSEASHDRGAKLEKLFKVGDTIDVVIQKIDDKASSGSATRRRSRILGRRRPTSTRRARATPARWCGSPTSARSCSCRRGSTASVTSRTWPSRRSSTPRTW